MPHLQLLDITDIRYGIQIPNPMKTVIDKNEDTIVLSLIYDYINYRRQQKIEFVDSVHTRTDWFNHWCQLHATGYCAEYTHIDKTQIRGYIKAVYTQLDLIVSGSKHKRTVLQEEGFEVTTGGPLPADYFRNRRLSIKSHTKGIRPVCFLLAHTLI